MIHLAKNADAIFTTHKYLAGRLKRYNKNTHIAPNAIDPNQPQWQTTSKVLDDMTIFGWCGGVHHQSDLELMTESLQMARENNLNLALGGYNKSVVWNNFETIFSGGDYKNYVRIEGQDVYNYGKIYDYFTTCLIPLRNNEFNKCKSELKMIEAGFKKKAVIVSDVHPYTNLINNDNCLKVDEARKTNGWFKAMKRIADSKDLEEHLANELYQSVVVKHHIKNVNKVREEVFNSL